MDELEYRRLLKALPRAIEPERDLFPEIAARLESRPQTRAKWRGLFPFAAASAFIAVAFAVVWLGLQRLPGPNRSAMPAVAIVPVMLREAQAMRAEFDAALVAATSNRWPTICEQADPRWIAGWIELDAAEAALTKALEQDPNARFLLDRLKRVQERRLRLIRSAFSA